MRLYVITMTIAHPCPRRIYLVEADTYQLAIDQILPGHDCIEFSVAEVTHNLTSLVKNGD